MTIRHIAMATALVAVGACGTEHRDDAPVDDGAGGGDGGDDDGSADDGGEDGGGDDGAADDGGEDGGDDGGGDDGGGDDGGGDDGGGGDDIKYDVQSDETGPGPGGDQEFCTFVDILFVIDNSGSMCSFQAQLAQAFPGFVDAMYEQLPPDTDVHVGITTTSVCGPPNPSSHNENSCQAGETLDVIQAAYGRPTEGDHATWGNGRQGRLFEHQGQSYYAADTGDPGSKAGLSSWFSGAATAVGCEGCQFEYSSTAAAWALHSINEPHNAGFLRDEGAVLLIFVLSDEIDQSLDVEDLSFLHDTVTAAKSICGGDNCVVSGALFTPTCVEQGRNGAHTFLSSFGEEPVWGSIQDASGYDAAVGGALAEVVATTCEDIPPPK